MAREENVKLAPVVICLVLAGCAHATLQGEEGPSGEAFGHAAERVVVTGSHIPVRVDTRNGLPDTTEPVRIYSREDLDRTGEGSNIGAALSKLAPDVVAK